MYPRSLNLIAYFSCALFIANLVYSTTEINSLLKTIQVQYEIFSVIDKYIRNEENHLNSVKKSVVAVFSAINQNTTKSHEELVGHPINSYLLIKKLTRQWKGFKNVMKCTAFEGVNDFKLTKFLRESVDDTIFRIGSMQETFGLLARDIVNGRWGTIELNAKLTYQQCSKIGRYFYHNMNYELAAEWLEMGFELFEMEQLNEEELKMDLIYMLAKSLFMIGNKEEAIDYLEILSLVNDDVNLFTKQLEDHIKEITGIPYLVAALRLFPNQLKCNQLCKSLLEHEHHSVLKCRYNHENSHFLKLAPLKEELLSLNPLVTIFRNVLSEREIDVVKNISSDALDVATYGSVKGYTTNLSYRFGETTRINHTRHPVLTNILHRIDDMTLLSTKEAESLMVGHYNVGGRFVYHQDNFPSHWSILQTRKNRVASVVFYMNDVTLGGGTAFPILNFAIHAARGSAVTWRNLFPDGSDDERVKHCGCPVLLGQKWILTEWLLTQ